MEVVHSDIVPVQVSDLGHVNDRRPESPKVGLHSQVQQESAEQQQQKKRSSLRLAGTLIALFLSLLVAALDVTIVATAVPTIASDLNSAAGYTWVGGAYIVANCVAGPIWAKLSDIWGRKMILISAITVLLIGSVVCATAGSMSTLIVGRAVQGCAGGTLIMLVHICISDLFSVRTRSLVFGLAEAVWALAAGIGPTLGGVFADYASWRWCFWINIPVAGVAFILILLALDIKHEYTSVSTGLKAIDWLGTTTFLAGTLMLLLGLDFGGAAFPWKSAQVIALLVVGSLLIPAFLYCEARVAKYPLMPLGVFSKRSNVGSFLVAFFHGLTFMLSEYYLPLFFQSVRGATPFISGILLLAHVVPVALVGILCGVFIHRVGRFREVIWLGTFLMCLGTGLYITWSTDVSVAHMVGIQLLSGIGSGLLFNAPLVALQSQVQQREVATVTSTFTFTRDFAVALCVILGGVIFQNSMNQRSEFLVRAGVPASVVAEKLSGKDAAANVIITDILSDPAQIRAVREAFAWSVRNMFIVFTALGFLGFLSSFLIEASHLTVEHTETVTGIALTERPSVAPHDNTVTTS